MSQAYYMAIILLSLVTLSNLTTSQLSHECLEHVPGTFQVRSVRDTGLDVGSSSQSDANSLKLSVSSSMSETQR